MAGVEAGDGDDLMSRGLPSGPNRRGRRQSGPGLRPHRLGLGVGQCRHGQDRGAGEAELRLLLAGSTPERILCLTYTKTAAAEMQNRLLQPLANGQH